MVDRKPLNGTKTHPLTKHAKDVLEEIRRNGPIPSSRINPGVVDRLLREDLVELCQMDSPFKTIRGLVTGLRATQTTKTAEEAP